MNIVINLYRDLNINNIYDKTNTFILNFANNYLRSNNVLTNWIINKDFHIDNKRIENDKLKISFKNKIYINKKETQISRRYLNKENAILYNVKTSDNNNLETKIKFKEK